MDICVLTISSEQGITPPRRNWKYVTAKDGNKLCLCYAYTSVSVIQQILPSVSMAVDGELYTPVPALFTAAT